ncbi:MAG: hypothetical protein HYZ28_10750 [Myxococcales bacterium]|nr:hypothetical protein [Myxococcales bacterium]
MDVLIGGERARLSDADLLGVGGEARVYRWRDLAVKIFHPVDPAQPAAEKVRRDKLEKLRRFPSRLPREVLGPLELARDRRGQVLGYAMKAAIGAEDAFRLSQRKWREGVVPNEEVVSLFGNVHRVLGDLHGRGVVVGDLNDGNVLFRGREPFLIDADSMQFCGLPCSVGHERFLDPKLYGVDLTERPCFGEGTDWYAFAVMLFSSLLYVHPFGGLQKKYPTPLRRAEARHSILRPDVQYPRAAVHYRVLPVDVLDWFSRVFEKDERGAFPPRLLDIRWTRCRCGAEHARATCPECAALGAAASRDAVIYSGRCSAKVVFRTAGRILAAAVQGGLRYAYLQDGVVLREDGSEVTREALVPGVRFALSGPATWVGMGGKLARVLRGQVVERACTGTFGSSSVFAASAATCYRTESEWLVDSSTGSRIGRILEGQTWLRAGERLGLGFYRAGLLAVFFLFRAGRPGLAMLKLSPPGGRIVEADAVFDDGHALLSLGVERDGRRTNAMVLFGEDGCLRAEASGAPADGRMFASVRGKALTGGRIVCATDEGLLSLRADGGRLVEGTLFTDTQPFVGAGVELLPGPGGSVFVVGAKEITQLTLV